MIRFKEINFIRLVFFFSFKNQDAILQDRKVIFYYFIIAFYCNFDIRKYKLKNGQSTLSLKTKAFYDILGHDMGLVINYYCYYPI